MSEVILQAINAIWHLNYIFKGFQALLLQKRHFIKVNLTP